LRFPQSATAILLILVSTFAGAQSQPASIPQSPTFRSRSELVLVPVVVRDKHGKHVPNLKAEDFTLLENGKPQKIGNFEEVQDGGGPVEVAERATRPSDAGVYSNFVPDTKNRGLLIIAIDANNFVEFDGLKSRQYLIDFLQKSLRDDAPVALLVIGGRGVRVLHDFTTDTRVLKQALLTVGKPDPGAGPTPADVMVSHNDAYNPLPKATGDAFGQSAGSIDQNRLGQQQVPDLRALLADEVWAFQQKQRTADSLDAMESIANAYAGVPGRKALIWISSSLPFATPGMNDPLGMSLTSQYERNWRALNAANIAVYPVDARGVFNPSFDAFDVRSTHSIRDPIRPEMQRDLHDMGDQTVTSFYNLAKNTGGKACVGRNELDKCFEIAAAESREFYMLSFYVGDHKPGWHKLSVKVSQPNVNVESRSGFYLRDPKPLNPEELKTELAFAITGKLNATAVPFQVKILGIAPAGNATDINFAVALAPHSVELGAENNLDIEIAGFAKLDSDKKNKEKPVEFSKNLAGKLKPESANQLLNQGMNYRGKLTLPAGQYTVKFVVRDNNTSKIGTVAVPIQVR
jgi:VWFA-related protein